MRTPACILVLSVLAALAASENASTQTQDPCREARELIAAHELDKARDSLMDVVDEDGGCVRRNLATLRVAYAQEKALCAEAKKLAEAEKAEEARRVYVRALGVDVG